MDQPRKDVSRIFSVCYFLCCISTEFPKKIHFNTINCYCYIKLHIRGNKILLPKTYQETKWLSLAAKVATYSKTAKCYCLQSVTAFFSAISRDQQHIFLHILLMTHNSCLWASDFYWFWFWLSSYYLMEIRGFIWTSQESFYERKEASAADHSWSDENVRSSNTTYTAKCYLYLKRLLIKTPTGLRGGAQLQIRGLPDTSSEFYRATLFHSRLRCGLESHSETLKKLQKNSETFVP